MNTLNWLTNTYLKPLFRHRIAKIYSSIVETKQKAFSCYISPSAVVFYGCNQFRSLRIGRANHPLCSSASVCYLKIRMICQGNVPPKGRLWNKMSIAILLTSMITCSLNILKHKYCCWVLLVLGGGGGVSNIRAYLLQSILRVNELSRERISRMEMVSSISMIKMFLNTAHGYIQEPGCQ